MPEVVSALLSCEFIKRQRIIRNSREKKEPGFKLRINEEIIFASKKDFNCKLAGIFDVKGTILDNLELFTSVLELKQGYIKFPDYFFNYTCQIMSLKTAPFPSNFIS